MLSLSSLPLMIAATEGGVTVDLPGWMWPVLVAVAAAVWEGVKWLVAQLWHAHVERRDADKREAERSAREAKEAAQKAEARSAEVLKRIDDSMASMAKSHSEMVAQSEGRVVEMVKELNRDFDVRNAEVNERLHKVNGKQQEHELQIERITNTTARKEDVAQLKDLLLTKLEELRDLILKRPMRARRK